MKCPLETNIAVLKTVLFTTISTSNVTKLTVSEVLPLLQLIAKDWNLNLKHEKDFKTAKRILVNCVKLN